MSRFSIPFIVAPGLLCVAGAVCGCARDRDFAVVEPPLSRQYQALAAAPPTRVVGVQPVAGQAGIVQPVYQGQPAAPTAVPNAATVALPPVSSTGAAAPSEPNGQPYYAPPPLSVTPAPGPTVVATQTFAPSGVQPAVATASVPVKAGVYPVGAGGMWTPTHGNQQIAIHQFATPTTGSSFVPSAPIAGGTPSSMQMSEGVVPAGAAVPFVSGIPANAAPPPQDTRSTFLSETGEHTQASRIPPPVAASASTNPPINAPAARSSEFAPLARPPAIVVTPQTKQPDPSIAERPEAGASRPARPKSTPGPVESEDDIPKSEKTVRPNVAPSADPPRTPERKSDSSGSPPSKLNLPNENKKGSDVGALKKGDDLDALPAPLKSKTPPTKKQAKDDGSSPGMELPDDPPLPPKTGSGS